MPDEENDARIPATSQEWFEWLAREEERTKAAYREKPALLIADFNRERAIARDYEGRELLELLQNANDQAAERQELGKVLIELSEDGLLFANTGLPFSTGGVGSLQTSHLSPKRHARRRLIGNKGLGFRSVLNWTRTPLIISDALSIAYSESHARKILDALKLGHPELERRVREEASAHTTLVLPMLLFPLYAKDGALGDRLDDPRARRLFDRGEELLLRNFNTVIGMPFSDAGKYAEAASQMEQMRPEILLFADSLHELCFRYSGKETSWRREPHGDITAVMSGDDELGRWQVSRSRGTLPPEFDDGGQDAARDWEIVVAVPVHSAGESGLLYSHFPTDVSFPLPLVCHASVDLEQNRKHLQQGRKSNTFVLAQLAAYVAETAEIVAEARPEDPWAGTSLLKPTGEFPVELRRENFLAKMLQAAQSRRIVPTLGRVHVTPGEARQIPAAGPDWLPPRVFPEVVPVRSSSDSGFLNDLGVPPMSPDEIRERVRLASDLTLAERVNLITGLLRHEQLKSAHTSALLLDAEGRPLAQQTRVFLSPSSGKVPTVPAWAELRFLNDEMRERLADRLQARDSRELQQKLSGFGLTEYSLANVISALIAEANRAEKVAQSDATVIRTQLLRTVYDLYDAEPESRRPAFPERSSLRLPDQSGGHAAATSLYLGQGFGVSGEIVQALYGRWAPEKLIDLSELALLAADVNRLSAFLLWVGAARWPREVSLQKASGPFFEYTLNAVRFPAKFEDKVVSSAAHASYAQLHDVRSIDGLSGFLEAADPVAVVAWLVSDERALSWSKRSAENGKLLASPDGVHRPRKYDGSLPCHIRWCIEGTNWLRSSDGTRLRPKDCVLGERVAEALFPRPEMPDSAALARFDLGPREVLEGWQRAGVLTSLAYLEQDEIYAKLLELPQRSPDGTLARPLYHWLLDASDTALAGEGPNRRRFLSEGRMWGYHGKIGAYFPIKVLHHTDVEGLPDELLARLNIVHLRRRVGADKVERLFGVKSVDRAGIQRRILSRQLAVGSSHADADFQQAKPFLHRLRISQTTQANQLQVLKDLRLEACSSMHVELTFEGTPLHYDLPKGGWIIHGNCLSVRVDPARPLRISESLLADSIAEALASIFRIADGGEFARLLTCEQDDRLELLRRLGGESILDGLEEIRAEYARFEAPQPEKSTFPLTPSPQPSQLPATEVDTAAITLHEPSPPVQTEGTEGSEQLIVVELDHVPASPISPRKLQIRSVATQDAPVQRTHDVTDGELCEMKAEEFERSDDPPRWPVRVGQVMGSDGPGCDLISFSSAEDCALFKGTGDLNLVSRFIEVKGRGSATASIELKGNELSAAERFKDRYYLYRLSEVSPGEFQLAILRDPLARPEALQSAVHVTMQRSRSMQRFVLTGGLQSRTDLGASSTV